MIQLFRCYIANMMVLPALFFMGITTFFTLFFAVILSDKGLSTDQIALHYLGIFALASVLVMLKLNNRKKAMLCTGLVATPMILIPTGLLDASMFGLTISMAVVSSIAIAIKDLVTQQLQSNYVTLAYQSGLAYKSITTFSFLINMICAFGLSFLGAMLLDAPNWFWGVTAVLWLVSVGLYVRFGYNAHIAQNETPGRSAPVDAKPEIPSSVRFQCYYVTIYAGVFYVARFFLLPTMVYQATIQLGFEKYAFQMVVVAIGGITLTGMLLQQFVTPSTGDSKRGMVTAYYINNILWITIAACGYWAFHVDADARWPYLIAVISLLFLEISSKIWTVSFFTALNDQAVYYAGSKNSGVFYEAYMRYYITLKNLGGVYSFGAFLLLSLFLTPQVSLMMLCVISVLYHVTCYHRAFPDDQRDSASPLPSRA